VLKTITPGARKGADFLVHVDPLQLKVQGVTVVGFYMKHDSHPNRTTREQIAAYHKAGISVFLIHQAGYEGKSTRPEFYGALHGAEAKARAKALGYPESMPIVFASMGDYDNIVSTLKGSAAYFNAAKKACAPYPAGLYGDWDIMSKVGPTPLSVQAAAKSWSWDWATNKWKGVHPTAHILQRPSRIVAQPKVDKDPTTANWYGTAVDPLDIVKQVTAWGPGPDVAPSKPVLVAKPILKRTISPRVNEQVKLLQRQLAYPWKWYTGPDDGKFYGMTQAAVKKMQAALKLPVNGVYDVRTATAFSKFLTAMRDLAVKK